MTCGNTKTVKWCFIALAFFSNRLGEVVWGQFAGPEIQWQLNLGGTGFDSLWSLQQTSDGGYIFGGNSDSTNGTKAAPNYGSSDFWIVRTDVAGTKLWEQSFGGTGGDGLRSLQQTSDGGYILGGFSYSGADGNKTSTNYGGGDFWVIRLDPAGVKLWEATFGGINVENLNSLQQTADGGFILGGTSTSGASGNKTSPGWGYEDFWVVRLDANGNKLWDQTYGGSSTDVLTSLKETSDGGFVLGGYSFSEADGTKTAPSSVGYGEDSWLVRIDGSGNQLWDKTYLPRSFPNRGPGHPQIWAIDQTSDHGYLLGEKIVYSITTIDFDEVGFGVVRIDAQGNELWNGFFSRFTLCDTCIGLYSSRTLSDTGFILGGYCCDIPMHFWIVRLDENGKRLWDRLYGGPDRDELRSLQQTRDGGFILGGRSYSGVGGNKTTTNYGSADFWVVKLGPEPPRLRVGSELEDGFHLQLLPGETNNLYRIERSTDLLDWTAFHTNQPKSYRVEIIDPSPGIQSRFYRAERLPMESGPVLQLDSASPRLR